MTALLESPAATATSRPRTGRRLPPTCCSARRAPPTASRTSRSRPDQLERLYELLRFPPTAMNTQPLRVVLVSTPEAKERLLPHLAEGNRAKSASAPLVAVLAADTDFHEHLPRLLPHAPGAKDRFADDERREQAARFNATLQAGYFILAVRAVGLDAGPMGGFDAAGDRPRPPRGRRR